jgi:hypothetical protein
LIVSAVPIMEPSIPQFVFFFAFFFSKLNMFNTLKITGILCFHFFFKKFLQPLWSWEEPEILYLHQLFLLGLI